MTIQEAKDTIAKKYGHTDWDEVLRQIRIDYITFTYLRSMENESIQLYASECCKQQRENCAEIYKANSGGDFDEYLHTDILETLLVVEVKQ